MLIVFVDLSNNVFTAIAHYDGGCGVARIDTPPLQVEGGLVVHRWLWVVNGWFLNIS